MLSEEEIRRFCYRVTHIQNLRLILNERRVRYFIDNPDYIQIGDSSIIARRKRQPVRIENYGNIGDYVPFYFTPRSIMLYNIITGHRNPLVPQRAAEDLIILRCSIVQLAQLTRWFFTDGQANDMQTRHYNDLNDLDKVDWECIRVGNFTKSAEDYDRPRRYQAEFLVFQEVPLDYIESINVCSQKVANKVTSELRRINCKLAVYIKPDYFFSL